MKSQTGHLCVLLISRNHPTGAEDNTLDKAHLLSLLYLFQVDHIIFSTLVVLQGVWRLQPVME